MSGSALPPRQELAALIVEATARGLTASELTKIQDLGSDGYGVIAQLEQIYVWLARHPVAVTSTAPLLTPSC